MPVSTSAPIAFIMLRSPYPHSYGLPCECLWRLAETPAPSSGHKYFTAARTSSTSWQNSVSSTTERALKTTSQPLFTASVEPWKSFTCSTALRTASLSLRFARFRTTAFPTRSDAENPNRDGFAFWLRADLAIKLVAIYFCPRVWTLRKSRFAFNR